MLNIEQAQLVENLHDEFMKLMDEYEGIMNSRADGVYERKKAITTRQKAITDEVHRITMEALKKTTPDPEPSPYPECEKLHKVSHISQQIGEFLDWLREQHITLCRWQDTIRHSDEFGDYTPQGYYMANDRTEKLLADFFEIDLDKVEEERLAMLKKLRGRNVG